MPFTEPPKYDADREVWPDFVGETVIVEPIKKLYAVQTRFGEQDAYEAIVWVLGNGELTPHPSIRIFNSRLVAQLEVAQRQNAPIAGVVQREGNSVRLVPAPQEVEDYLLKLWEGMGS